MTWVGADGDFVNLDHYRRARFYTDEGLLVGQLTTADGRPDTKVEGAAAVAVLDAVGGAAAAEASLPTMAMTARRGAPDGPPDMITMRLPRREAEALQHALLQMEGAATGVDHRGEGGHG